MNRLLLLSLLLIATLAQAQTITKADFLSRVGIQYTSTEYTADTNSPNMNAIIDALVAKSGTGQTWDLSALTYNNSGQSTSVLQAGTSGATGAEDPAFSSSNYVTKSWLPTEPIKVYWNFETYTDDALYSNGFTADSAGILAFKLTYTPPMKSFVFPLAFGSSWVQGVTTFQADYGGFPVTIEQTSSNTVDGSGTLILPGGKSGTALRIRQETQSKVGPVLTQYFYDTTVSYSIISVDGNLSASFQPAEPPAFPGGPQTPAFASYSVAEAGGSNPDVTVAPTLISPADAAVITGTQAELSWGTVANATAYHVQVSQLADFSVVLNENSSANTSASFTLGTGLYYWRVAGVSSESKEGPWSSVRTFTMASSGVREKMNDVFTLLPNTPNPFAGATTISYMLHKDAHVKIVVHDQLGKEIATITDGIATAGTQSVSFDAKQLPSGTYYYTVTAGGKSLTMAMSVTK